MEDHVCLSGSDDRTVRLWDLRRVESDDSDWWGDEGEIVSLSDITEESENGDEPSPRPNGIRNGEEPLERRNDPCARVLEGHTKAVTALYFDDDCLVR